MTDKERLEMIKHDLEERSQYGGFLDDCDTDWLIEQAERVEDLKGLVDSYRKRFEELQKVNTKLNHEIGAYSGKIGSIAEKLLLLEKEMLHLEK